MNSEIKQIEDMSLNAWPSHKWSCMTDGSPILVFYTHRTNSVEQFGIPLCRGKKKSPTANLCINAWALRQFLRSALLSLLILITYWKTEDMKFSIQQTL